MYVEEFLMISFVLQKPAHSPNNTWAQDYQSIFLIKVATKEKIGILFLLTCFLLQTSLIL